jgi:hypothetical protein
VEKQTNGRVWEEHCWVLCEQACAPYAWHGRSAGTGCGDGFPERVKKALQMVTWSQ